MINERSRLFDFLEDALERMPKDDLLCAKENGQWIPMSTQEVANQVEKLAAGLLRLGLSGNDMSVEKQDKIALISRNRPEWVLLDLACQQAGICLCPIYPTTNINELDFIFNDAEIKYVFISGKDIYTKVHNIDERVPSLKGIYSFDEIEGTIYWDTLMKDLTEADMAHAKAIKHSIKPEHCATIIYTSGTTGTPKGVMLSHRNIVSNVVNAKASFPFETDTATKALSFLPLNHIFERVVTYIYLNSGTSIFYAENLETIGENIKEVKPTVFATVPRLLEKVYEKIEAKGNALSGLSKKIFDWSIDLANRYEGKSGGFAYDMQLALANKLVFSKWREALGNNIRYIITGGAACQVRLIRIFSAAKIPIYEGYGPTENSPVITVNCKSPGGTKFGTVGLVIKGQEVKLEEDGEICVKGPSVMMGYYKRPDLTEEVIKGGWLHTGDIGVWEDGKYLKITDRKKELFKTSGGKYVAPAPIENKMKESPYVEQMMVVGAEKKFVGALIVPSIPNLKQWMAENGIDFTTADNAIKHPKVMAFYKDLVEAFNRFFNQVEQVKRFELLPKEWTIDSGELTPTLKLKRKVIMEKYRDAIERIYGSNA